MGLISKAFTFVGGAGNKIRASEVNKNFDDLYTLVNGLLDASNLSPSALISLGVSAGDLRAHARAAPSSGWLACDGAAVSRSTYAALFAAIGTAFGVGDGSTTFNLPDLRGRTPIGAGTGSGLSARALGAKAGTEPSNMPSHNHGGGNHQHGVTAANGLWGDTGGAPTVAAGANHRMYNNNGTLFSGNIISTEGGGSDNMPPFQAVNWEIKT